MAIEYTKEEFKEFKKLVCMQESSDQLTRITGRMKMPEFIERCGKEKCDAMFEVLLKEDK